MKRALSLLMVIAGFAMTLFMTTQALAAVVYVNQAIGTSGDGLTWETAKKTLEEGLAIADSVNYPEVYVAQGRYVPATTFTMKSGVSVYGGFASGDAFAARNWVTKVTTLSGDVNNDDQPSFANRTDNRLVIVTFGTTSGNARLDGFIVSGGGPVVTAGVGGGIIISGCPSPGCTIENCWVRDNQSDTGGGIFTPYQTVPPAAYGTVKNCIISGNLAKYGGGIYLNNPTVSSQFTFINCTITGNARLSTGRGGGVFLNQGHSSYRLAFTMKNCIVWNNIISGTATRMNMYYRGYCNTPPNSSIAHEYNYYSIDAVGSTTAPLGTGDVRNTDPQLTSASDFHLTGGSGCKDPSGPITTAPAKDYDLVTRDATPDIGAYEFVSGGDTTPPGEVTGVSVTPGHQYLTLGWTNPGDGDFGGVVVIRKLGSAPTGVPSGGATYTAGSSTIGGDSVVYVGSGSGFTDSGLVNGSTYYYKICTYDTPAKNYSTGVGTSGTPVEDTTSPDPVTGLAAASLSDSSIKLDWVNSASSDSLGVIILRKAGGLPTGIPADNTPYTAGATVGDGTVVYVGTGSSATPGGASTWTDSTLTHEQTTYGYSVFAYDIVPNYSTRADDSDVTLADSTAPADVSAQTATGDDGEVVLRWTNPSSIDIQGVLILRSTAGTPTGVPVAGTTYTTSDTIGGDAVVFVGGSPVPSGVSAWSDQGLNNTTPYYYKIFARDEHPNFAGGMAANATPTAPTSIKYVKWDAGGDNNGTSWTHAYTSLTNAIFNATSGDELWVAAGTYKPGTLTTDRFNLKANVKLYGGFTSGMTHRYERDWSANTTTLSGDLNGDDTASWGNRSENAVNVLYASSVTGVVLDGFTVRSGYSTTANGGGLYASASAVTVANCLFTDNRALNGGGAYLSATPATIESCRFVSNGTPSGGLGGGLWAQSASAGVSGTIRNSVFYDNVCGVSGVAGDGGGAWLKDNSYTLVNCTIYGNYAGRRGGGLKLGSQGVTPVTFTLKNCIVLNNTIGSGGGVDVYTQADSSTAQTLNMSYCNWSGGGTFSNFAATVNTANMQVDDPSFASPGTGDFSLTVSSPCIDAGTGSGAPEADILGVARPAGAGYDIGAYEFVVNEGADTTPPANVSGVSVTPGYQLLDLAWTPPVDIDFAGVLVLRKEGSAPTGTPGAGVEYTAGPAQTIGDGTVVYVGSGTSLHNTGLTIGTDYYYKLFAFDSLFNYAAGVGDHGVPVTDTTPPNPVGSLTAAAQSDSEIKLDWMNSSSSDLQGVIILRKTGGVPTGTPTALTTYTVGATVGDGTVVYVGTGSSATPGAASMWTDTTLTQELTTYGYSVFAYDAVPYYSTRADDSDVTLGDSTAPGNVTAQTATGDDGEVALAWTHPADTDVAGVLILRSTVATPTGVPVAGTTYTAGTPIGDGTVVYVSSSATPGGAGAWSDQGLANGTHYYYKIFAFDEHPNYASGGAAADATPAGPGSVKYVNGAMGAEGNGGTWTTAFKTLTNALFNATSGDELWVATGTYTPAAPGGATSSRFNLKANVKLYGGFTSGMAHRYERDWTNHVTTLSGDLGGDDTASWGNRSDNAVNVLYASTVTGVVLDGFTVRSGYSTTGSGGGLYASASAITVANCLFTDNRALSGGGMGLSSTPVTIENCSFVNNSANGSGSLGGGLRAESAATASTIRNSVFSGNRCEGGGNNDGGGLYMKDNSCTFVNCTISGNYAARRAGGLKLGSQGVTLVNFALKNCIVRDNTASSGSNIYAQNDGTFLNLDMSYCNWGGAATYNNWYATFTSTALQEGDPLFFNAAAGDFRLNCGSPCIDAGTGSGAPATDINGNTRPAGSGIDIGAYESTVYTVTVIPTAGATVTFNGQAYSASTVVPVEAGSYTASYTSPQADGTSTQYVFSAWTLDGNAAGSAASLSVPVNYSTGNRVLNATFTKKFKLALTVIGGAYGTMSGGTDGAWYDSGTVLVLDSHPLPRAVFVGLAGDCTGNEVTMDGAKSVTATFDSTDPTFIMFQ